MKKRTAKNRKRKWRKRNVWVVQEKHGERWVSAAMFASVEEAIEYSKYIVDNLNVYLKYLRIRNKLNGQILPGELL